jgi:hypothetical protein
MVSVSDTFDFYKISDNGWDWVNEKRFIKIDSVFCRQYIHHPEALSNFSSATYYFYGTIQLPDNMHNLIVIEYLHKNEIYMYLLRFDREGNRKKAYLLAHLFGFIDESQIEKSIIKDNKLVKFNEHFYDQEENTTVVIRDTMVNVLW